MLFPPPKTKMPLYYYTGVHALWMMNDNGGKRLTKKDKLIDQINNPYPFKKVTNEQKDKPNISTEDA